MDGESNPEDGNTSTVDQAAVPRSKNADKVELDAENRRRELHFKAKHSLLIVFFLWILSVPFVTAD